MSKINDIPNTTEHDELVYHSFRDSIDYCIRDEWSSCWCGRIVVIHRNYTHTHKHKNTPAHIPVVDVDGVTPMLVAKVFGEDLHVPRQHDEVDRLLFQDLFNLRRKRLKKKNC